MTTGEQKRFWFPIATSARKEAIVEAQIKALGFRTWLPKIKKLVWSPKTHRRTDERSYAFFAGYTFAWLTRQEARWGSWSELIGMQGMLCVGDQPVPVPDADVERWMRALDGAAPVRRLKVGDLVRVTDGAFRDFEGPVEELDESDRVWILLNVFGRPVRVVMPEAHAEPA